MNRLSVTYATACVSLLLVGSPARAWDLTPIDFSKTYPRDGQVEVPTNAKLFILNDAASVRVDGVEVPELEPGIWDPGALLPNTEYIVEFDAFQALINV